MSTPKQSFKEGLRLIARRPGMYVGGNRLDYFIRFFEGARLGFTLFLHEPTNNTRFCMYNWEFNYDIQKWLLLNESVSIQHAASLNAWQLMQRYYGVKQLGLEKLRVIVEEIEFSDGSEYSLEDTVSKHIYQIYRQYKYEIAYDFRESYNPKVSADYYPVSDKIKSIIGEVKCDYESLIPIITRMINEPYDDLLVYLHYDYYFMCVRFLYRTGKGDWVEFTNLSNQQDYYSNLVILHAYAALIQKEEHKNHIITIRKTNDEVIIESEEAGEMWSEIDGDVCVVDENSFAASYSRWLESHTTFDESVKTGKVTHR